MATTDKINFLLSLSKRNMQNKNTASYAAFKISLKYTYCKYAYSYKNHNLCIPGSCNIETKKLILNIDVGILTFNTS